VDILELLDSWGESTILKQIAVLTNHLAAMSNFEFDSPLALLLRRIPMSFHRERSLMDHLQKAQQTVKERLLYVARFSRPAPPAWFYDNSSMLWVLLLVAVVIGILAHLGANAIFNLMDDYTARINELT
jgi:hypothetical protein